MLKLLALAIALSSVALSGAKGNCERCSTSGRDVGLSKVNSFRATHGSGLLELSPALTRTALLCAQHYCNDRQTPCPWTKEESAESFVGINEKLSPENAAERSTQMWYDQKEMLNRAIAYPGGLDSVRDFVQMVWSSTTHAGFAACTCADGSTLAVTEYDQKPNHQRNCVAESNSTTEQVPTTQEFMTSTDSMTTEEFITTFEPTTEELITTTTQKPEDSSGCGNLTFSDLGLCLHNKYRGWHGTPSLKLDQNGFGYEAVSCANWYCSHPEDMNGGNGKGACPYKPSAVGENIHIRNYDDIQDFTRVISYATSQWYAEEADYAYSSPRCNYTPASPKITDFAQMMWKEATKVGYGVEFCPQANAMITVAHYDQGYHADPNGGCKSWVENILPSTLLTTGK